MEVIFNFYEISSFKIEIGILGASDLLKMLMILNTDWFINLIHRQSCIADSALNTLSFTDEKMLRTVAR